MNPRRAISGFVLLPVVATLVLVGVMTALLLERGGTIGSVTVARRDSDALAYAAEAGYAHARTLLGTWGGCTDPADLPNTPLGTYTYSAAMTLGATTPGSTFWFTAVADSWLKSADDNANFGSDTNLRNKKKSNDHRQTIVRFDLTSLPANLDIVTATLHLYVTSRDGTGNPVEIYWIDSAWIENWASWDFEGNDYDDHLLHGSFTPSTEGYFSANLTRLVRKWVSGAVPNYGMRFISTSNDNESVYASRETATTAQRPRLEVVTRAKRLVDIDASARDSAGVERALAGTVTGPAAGLLFLDYFNAGYAGNDGSRSWSGNWQEIGESNGTGSGAVRVVSSSTWCAYGNCLRIDADSLSTAGAWRELSLAGAASATLHLHTRRDGGNWTLQVSGNGGTSWQTLKSTGNGDDTNQVRDTFDISAYAASNTRIRVTSSQFVSSGAEDVYIDDVEVEAVCGP